MTDRTIQRETIEQCIETIDPDWQVRDARLPHEGFLPVYHVSVETADGPTDGPTDIVLKATPETGDHGQGIALESRLLSLIGDRTDVPVPTVLGAVDDHPDLPAPYFLMTRMPGETIHRVDIGSLTRDEMRHIARQTGRHAAQVHAIDAVERFGVLGSAGPEPGGEPPTPTPDSVEVVDPREDWPALVADWVDAECDVHANSRFGDRTDDIRAALEDRLHTLDGPFEPSITHVDNSIENVLVDPATMDVTAQIDWAFSLAAPPDYDLLYVERSLSGGHWAMLPDVPDFRPTVRTALKAGYREAGGDERALEQYEAHHDCYELLALARSMNLLEGWWDLRDMPADRLDAAARGHREAVQAFL